MGSDLFGDFAPGFHAHALRRLEESGLVSIGQTTVPELGIVNVTEGRRYGPTRNPWDTDRTPGGSSGGVGRRGGRRRLLDRPRLGRRRVAAHPRRLLRAGGPEAQPRAGVGRARCWASRCSSRTACSRRTVADTAAALDVLAGYELGDANWAPPPDEPFADAARREPGLAADRRGAGRARSTRRWTPSPSAACARRPSCCPRWGTRSRRSTRRGWAATCCPPS